MTVTARRAHPPTGSYDREEWAQHGACRDLGDLFVEADHMRGTAVHLCLTHCPVLAQCAADRDRTPRERLIGVVQAGVAHNASGQPRTSEPGEVACFVCGPDPAPSPGVCADALCGNALSPHPAAGRPRRFCSKRCADRRPHRRR